MIYIIPLLLLFSSCKKYLDVKKSSHVSIVETVDDCQRILDNPAYMNSFYPNDGENSADDYFIDINGYQNSKLTSEDKDVYIWKTNAIRESAYPQWQPAYATAYYANVVMETVNKLNDKGSADARLNELRGAALFFRAFSFWQIAQIYAKPYSSATAQDMGIPLRLSSDVNDKSERGTLQQTYDRIIQDLEEAASLLQPTSAKPTRPNKAAAYAMLARVYLSMEDYQKALSNSSLGMDLYKLLLNYNTIDQGSSTPFVRFNTEVIFHSTMYTNPEYSGNGSMLLASGEIAKSDPAFVNTYADDDLRKVIFYKADGTAFRFTGNYEPSTASNKFNGLATDELYITRAECYARAGNTSAALKDLNDLLRTRWKATATYVDITAASADAALEIILKERRKELIMRGLRWTDLRRLNRDARFKKDLTRSVTVDGVTTTYTLPANDPRYVLLIPNQVITNSSIQQNSR